VTCNDFGRNFFSQISATYERHVLLPSLRDAPALLEFKCMRTKLATKMLEECEACQAYSSISQILDFISFPKQVSSCVMVFNFRESSIIINFPLLIYEQASRLASIS
jgi:hypothetical protein